MNTDLKDAAGWAIAMGAYTALLAKPEDINTLTYKRIDRVVVGWLMLGTTLAFYSFMTPPSYNKTKLYP